MNGKSSQDQAGTHIVRTLDGQLLLLRIGADDLGNQIKKWFGWIYSISQPAP